MQVNILGNLFEFISDFDPIRIEDNVNRDWKVQAHDYFKFPVKIGPEYCFIKRFDRRASTISGYDLMLKVKGLKLKGLPIIYDVVTTVEADAEVIYLFTQYIKGNTIDNLQRVGFSFLPVKLAGDLFYAIDSIRDNGFWLPDFDPKNFIKSEAGDFYIIDLDSTYPISVLPAPSMHGSKDYWAPIYDFYQNYKNFSSEETRQIRGDVLNNLQLIYFMALYSFYLFDKGEDFSASTIQRLNEYLSGKYPLFSSTMTYCFHKHPQTNIISQKNLNFKIFSNLLFNCLFTDSQEQYISVSSNAKPKVQFDIIGHNTRIRQGHNYTLEWQTRNVTSVFLDDIKHPLRGSKNFTAFKDIVHTLKAIHNTNQVTESKISISVEIIPKIDLTVIPVEIESGSSVTIQWNVLDGQNIMLLQDQNIILQNCSQKGSYVINLTLEDNDLESKDFQFVMQAESILGELYDSDPVKVQVKKKRPGNTIKYILYGILIILLLLLIYFAIIEFL